MAQTVVEYPYTDAALTKKERAMNARCTCGHLLYVHRDQVGWERYGHTTKRLPIGSCMHQACHCEITNAVPSGD